MDPALRRAAEQEMRRPAPDAPPSKRPRTDGKAGATRGFSELGRFDYRAAEQLAQGAQGFIVTCGFQRDKSATREAMAVLQEVAASFPSLVKLAFDIVKLPYCGVILLIWRAAQKAQEADLSQPGPSDIVELLVQAIHSKRRPALKHVQRITPVDGICLASDAAIRQLVSSLTEAYIKDGLSGLRGNSSMPALADRAPITFAVAFKSRLSGSQKSQTDAAGEKQACKDGRAANTAAGATANARSLDDQCGGGKQPNEQQGQRASENTGVSVSSHKSGSAPSKQDEVTPETTGSSTRDEGPRASQGKPEVLDTEQTGSASDSISRAVAIAAAAESFAAACKSADMCAQVDLKQPSIVIFLEILPMGGGAIAAASLVDSQACILTPKLALKSLQM